MSTKLTHYEKSNTKFDIEIKKSSIKTDPIKDE